MVDAMDANDETGAPVATVRCPDCGASSGMHTLACSHFTKANWACGRLSDEELAELRTLLPSRWEGWPPEDYDQGLPVVEVRQDHLLALLDELVTARKRER
jgi:hypothetical protein